MSRIWVNLFKIINNDEKFINIINTGNWWIEIVKEHEKTSSYRANFEVKKYVLPKFEVVLNHKKTLSPRDKNIKINVCAK
jgi:hypothetical protein